MVVYRFIVQMMIKKIFLLKMKKFKIKNTMKELINLSQVQNIEVQKRKDIKNFFKK